MPVPFKVVSRKNPASPAEPEKYYASLNASGEITIRDLAAEIAEITTMSLPDVIGVLESLVMLIPKHTRQGRIIRLGEIGSLRVSAKSEGCDTEGEVNAGKIKNTKYIFTPGKELKKALKALEFAKMQKAK